MRAFFVSTTSLLGIASHTQDSLASEGVAEEVDPCRESVEADIALEKVHAHIMGLHEDDSLFLRKFEDAKGAWLRFRDHELNALFPGSEKSKNDRSGVGGRICSEKKVLTLERAEVLSSWRKEVPGSDVCTSPVSETEGSGARAVQATGACNRLDGAEGKLNEVYHILLDRCRHDAEFLKDMKKAQRAWMTLRDADVAARFSAGNGRAFYGSSFHHCMCAEKETMTKERTRALERGIARVSGKKTCAESMDLNGTSGKVGGHVPRLEFLPVSPLHGPGLAVSSVFASGDRVYAGNSSGGLAISTDAGKTWLNKTSKDGLASDFVRKIRGSGSTVYVATAGGVSISTDFGRTWVNKSSKDGLGGDSIWDISVSGNKIYAVFASRWDSHLGTGISLSTNGGDTWSNMFTKGELGSSEIRKVVFAENRVYAATNMGLLVTNDDGKTWLRKTERDGLGENDVTDVFVSGEVIYLATGTGVSVSKDAGMSWKYVKEPNSAGVSQVIGWNGVIYLASSLMHPLGDRRVLVISNDEGATWSRGRNPDIDPEDDSESLEARLFHSSESPFFLVSDGGIVSVPRNRALKNVNDVSLMGKTLYVATPEGLLISSDNGKSWVREPVEGGLADNIADVVVQGDGLIFVKTQNEVLFSANGGKTWSKSAPQRGLPRFWSFDQEKGVVTSDGIIYKPTNEGLAISGDGGKTWTKKTLRDGLGSKRLNEVFVAGCKVYAATNGGLSISSDGGANWDNKTQEHGLPSSLIEQVTVLKNAIYVRAWSRSRQNGQYFVSYDGGKSWGDKAITDETGTSFKLSDASSLWVQGDSIFTIISESSGEYTLLFSIDGGMTWMRRLSSRDMTASPLHAQEASGCTIYAMSEGRLYKADVCSGEALTNVPSMASAKGPGFGATCPSVVSVFSEKKKGPGEGSQISAGAAPCGEEFGRNLSPHSMAKTILCPLAHDDRRTVASLFLGVPFSFMRNDGAIVKLKTVDDFVADYQEIMTSSLRTGLERLASSGSDDEIPALQSWVEDFGNSAMFFAGYGGAKVVNKGAGALKNMMAKKIQRLKVWKNAAGQEAWCQGAKNAYVVSDVDGVTVLAMWGGSRREKGLWSMPPSRILFGEKVNEERSSSGYVFFDDTGYIEYETNSGSGLSCDSCDDGTATFYKGTFENGSGRKPFFQEGCAWTLPKSK